MQPESFGHGTYCEGFREEPVFPIENVILFKRQLSL